MIPDELVGIEIGRVSGQEVEFQTATRSLDKLGGQPRPMRRMAIDHQEDRLPAPPEKRLQERAEGDGARSTAP